MREKLIKFMEGRYGADEMFYMLTVLYVVLVFVNIIAHSWVLHILSLGVFAYSMFRALSRNREKRSEENRKLMSFVDMIRGRSISASKRREQNRDYYFTKCPSCGKTLRLPRVKGKHGTRCPACQHEFRVNIRRGRPAK